MNIEESLKTNLARVRERIAGACAKSGRPPEDVHLVAVTKAVEVPVIARLVGAGHRILGENRVQALKKRSRELLGYLELLEGDSDVEWQMIGHLQRKKVRQVLPLVSLIHSVDSLPLMEEIEKHAQRLGKRQPILLEVNCGNEPQKYGLPVGGVTPLIEQTRDLAHLEIQGLMTMAPLTTDPEKTRPVFVRLRELFDELREKNIVGESFRHLSMGMSQDYPIAVEEGATLIRVGTALFEGITNEHESTRI